MDSLYSSSLIRVLVFPWLGHSHITSFLELCGKLSERNFHVIFCSTPVILGPVRQKFEEMNLSSIELVEIHLPSLPELPPQYHTPNGLPPHLMDTLMKAFDMASPSFHSILASVKPDLLISDFLQSWAPAPALSLGIPTVLFLVTGTVSNPFMVSSLKDSGATVFPLRCNHVSDDPAKDNPPTFGDRLLRSLESSSALMLVKSFREIEGNYMDELSVLTSKKIVPVGPLAQDPNKEDENAEITEWLSKKEPSSVVFVCFGSESYLSKDEREELAHGLLLSKVNFIWVLRFPQGEKISAEEALPEGFLEMMGERGLIVEAWAPQKRILAHPSTGGFVSASGWGSVTESMASGVPIIAVPMRLEHPYVARLVEELGVGLEIKRDKSGRFGRKEVERVINEVMLAKTSENIRNKAKEIRDCIRQKQELWINQAVDELVNLCDKRKPTAAYSNFLFIRISWNWLIFFS